jgi:hypothetical protein
MSELEGMFVNVRLMMYTGEDEDGSHMMTAVAHSPELTRHGVIQVLQYAAAALEKEVEEDGLRDES